MDEKIVFSKGSFFHGTKADLAIGDLIVTGKKKNYNDDRKSEYVYFAGTLDAAVWGAELAEGDGRERIYVVEPTGDFEDDPNLTDKKFPGNPTRSYRSKQPLSAARLSKSPRNIIPAPSEMKVAVKIREMMAMSVPIVASLAVRARNTNRFCPRYFRAGRLSKKAGTPEAKLRKNPNRNTIKHPAPMMPKMDPPAISRQVPATPSTMETEKIQRRTVPV